MGRTVPGEIECGSANRYASDLSDIEVGLINPLRAVRKRGCPQADGIGEFLSAFWHLLGGPGPWRLLLENVRRLASRHGDRSSSTMASSWAGYSRSDHACHGRSFGCRSLWIDR